MIKKNISKDWYFQNMDRGKDNTVRKVDLPHDYAMENGRSKDYHFNTGHYEGGAGKYVKYLYFDKKEHTILDIDGAYMCAQIRLNHTLDTLHPYGYTPYLVDLTDHMMLNMNNRLEILTDDMAPSSRWYSGAGIYREVALWTGGDVRIEPWDLYVTTEKANEDFADITVRTWVSADYDCTALMKLSLCGLDKEAEVNCKKGEKTVVCIPVTVKKPMLWDIDAPNLYELKAEVYVDGTKTDEFAQEFGIREISYTVENGFMLNGRMVKLQGGCIHHDHGGLGAAAYAAAEERKIRKLKEAGYNSVRIAHNPPSLHLLNACDKLGMLVMDEAFDMWTVGKNSRDYHLFFREWYERDISYMVMRDRSHPCVISYSTGNEIFERGGDFQGAEWSKRLADAVRKYDATRPVTSTINGAWIRQDKFRPEDYGWWYLKHITGGKIQPGEGMNDHWPDIEDTFFEQSSKDYSSHLDIVGYNYFHKRYEQDLKTFPDRIIWGSETWAITFYDSWKLVEKHNNIIGDYVWTAYDNIGETGGGRFEWGNGTESISAITTDEYPWRLCFQGDLDLAGFRRPQSYFKEIFWKKDAKPRLFVTHPKYFGKDFRGTRWHWYDVKENWTFDDEYIGKECEVHVYTLQDEVVFYVNDKKIGSAVPEKGIAKCVIPYEKGVLKAEVFKDGRKVDECTLETNKGAYTPSLKVHKTALAVDDICYVEIELNDMDGRWVADEDKEIKAICSGGKLLSMFSGHPKNEDDYLAGKCCTFMGRAVLVVKATEPGEITVTVGVDGLRSSEVKINVTA